jgi:hypothetical protein
MNSRNGYPASMERIVPSAIARLVAAQRRIEQRTCAVCGTEVPGTVRRRYCSNSCVQKAAYARHAQKRRAARRERYRRQREQSAAPDT